MTAPLLVCAGLGGAPAAETKAPAAPPAAAAPVLHDLAVCRQLALERQPAVRAAHASLGAAAARSAALDNLCVPTVLQRDLPVRRQQAALGVQIAHAGVQLAETEAVYAVTRNYLSVLYARQQEKLAREAVKNLKEFEDAFRELVAKGGGGRDLNKYVVARAEIYRRLAESRLGETVEGQNRALGALREAMGVGPEGIVTLPDAELPPLAGLPSRDELVALALARRAELAQASLAAEVVCLEATAQGQVLFRPTTRTFAAGSDLHAQQVPQGERNGEYRPGALSLEMPGILVGKKTDRVDQARTYHTRSLDVVEKTRNLIVLEIDDNFLKWREASTEYQHLLGAAKEAKARREELRKELKESATIPGGESLNIGVLAAQTQGQANEAHYRALLALAALERATAGGFLSGIGAPVVKSRP